MYYIFYVFPLSLPLNLLSNELPKITSNHRLFINSRTFKLIPSLNCKLFQQSIESIHGMNTKNE